MQAIHYVMTEPPSRYGMFVASMYRRGQTLLAVAGLGVSLLIILVAPARAAGAAPGRAPLLSAREWAMAACILLGLVQAVRWMAAGVA